MIGLGPIEILIILIIALVVVGPERLPELMRLLAKAYREIVSVADEVKDQLEDITSYESTETKTEDSYLSAIEEEGSKELSKSPEEVKPEEVSPEEVTPEEVKPEEVSPEEVTPEEVKPEEVNHEEVTSEEVKPEGVKPKDEIQ